MNHKKNQTRRRKMVALMLAVASVCVVSLASRSKAAEEDKKTGKAAVDISSRLELFVDDFLIDKIDGAELCLHRPVPQEVAITFDAPSEGNTSTYVTILRDGDLYRMYFRGSHFDWDQEKSLHQHVCYAESKDGIRWTRPELNLVDFKGSKQNNVVWNGTGSHNFTPFIDTNPACLPEQRYKAVGSTGGKLYAFVSANGLNWKQMRDEPVQTKGAFDSQNITFWDAYRNRYVDFHRGTRNGVRDIMTSTSDDFQSWTTPQYIDQGDAKPEHLYTNATIAYQRAPHIFLAFPKRFVPSRKAAYDPLGGKNYPGVSDGVFMASRDGMHWKRWGDAFIRPGKNIERWWQRNNMTAWGIVQTQSNLPGHQPELSFYSTENYYVGPCRLRRYTLRLDGFVSAHASYKGGEIVTRPITFDGKQLVINFATSAAGSVRCELQNAAGSPIPGYTLADCDDIYGDHVEHVVGWKTTDDVSSLAGQEVLLRIVLKDADVYSLRFRP